jgi:hypothetical protein
MKHILLTCLTISFCFLLPLQTNAQSFKDKQLSSKYLSEEELISDMSKYDFSQLFTHTDNSVVYGFIGDNYQRIRIKFISVVKNQKTPADYTVYGKSMVKNNICEFHGTITITNIRKYKSTSYGVDDEYKNKGIKGQFSAFGNYIFSENQNQIHSGVFKGTFRSNFYLDKSANVHYDDIKLNADSYTNNQFVGQWISYKGNLVKRCNWGDFRVPNDGDLDIGAGEFSPNEKYLKFGWQTRHNLMVSQSDKGAKPTEEAHWWK